MSVVFDREGKATGITVGGRKLPSDEASALASECRTLSELPVFRLLIESLKSEACQRMYFHSKTMDDLLGAKMMLWTVEEAQRQIGLIAKVVPQAKKP